MNSQFSFVSRRQFSTGFARLLLPVFAACTAAQERAAGDLTPRLVHEFESAVLLAVSSDEARICLYFSKSPIDSYRLEAGSWFHVSPKRSGGFLQVLEVGDLTPVYSGQFLSKVTAASFFADGRRIYVETQPVVQDSHLARQQTIVNLSDGQRVARVQPVGVGEVFESYAIGPSRLLLKEYGRPVKNRAGDLVIIELPDYRDVKRASFATRERERFGPTIGGGGIESLLFFSPDRSRVAYSFDHTLVFRNTVDLGVVWTREFGAEYTEARHLSVCADGRMVAAAVTDSAFSDKQTKFYVGIYDGNDGRELTRLAVSGTDGLGLSADGKLIAVGDRKSPSAPTVHIYEVSSGRRLASVAHDHLVNQRSLFLVGGFTGIEFTPDGKYLVSSGAINTKIWALGRV